MPVPHKDGVRPLSMAFWWNLVRVCMYGLLTLGSVDYDQSQRSQIVVLLG
jgi:hypothetical protein